MVMLSPEDVRAAKPILSLAIVMSGILAALMIAAGTVAIIWRSQAASDISVLGIHITTGDVGVALVGLGAITAIVVIRRALQVVGQIALKK